MEAGREAEGARRLRKYLLAYHGCEREVVGMGRMLKRRVVQRCFPELAINMHSRAQVRKAQPYLRPHQVSFYLRNICEKFMKRLTVQFEREGTLKEAPGSFGAGGVAVGWRRGCR